MRSAVLPLASSDDARKMRGMTHADTLRLLDKRGGAGGLFVHKRLRPPEATARNRLELGRPSPATGLATTQGAKS